MNYKILCLFAILLISLPSCKDEGDPPSFDKATLLHNITTQLLLPTFEEFAQKTEILQQKTSIFNTKQDLASLVDLQSTWKETTLQWKRTEVFGFGPADDYESQIYFHPARTNLIEAALNDQTSIDINYISLLGAAAKGLPTLEVLLFENGLANEDVLALFTNDTQGTRRLNYVVGITQHLQKQATDLHNDWISYATQFTTNTSGSMNSVSQLANQLLLVIENTVNRRLGEPLGKNSGGTPIPEKAEAFQSKFSKELILSNLYSASEVYHGVTQVGFDDYLDFITATYLEEQILSEVITQYLNSYIQKVEALESPLQVAVINDQAQVETAHQEGRMLSILMKTDMFSALSITIAFTDNDGD